MATLASLPDEVMMPCNKSDTLTFLPTSINILEPPVFHAFLLIKTSSFIFSVLFCSSKNAIYEVIILVILAGGI